MDPEVTVYGVEFAIGYPKNEKIEFLKDRFHKIEKNGQRLLVDIEINR